MSLTAAEERKFDRASRVALMSAELGRATGEMAERIGLDPHEVAEVLAGLQATVARGIGRMYVLKRKRARK